MNESDAAAQALNELAFEYSERLRRGETPQLREYTERYPLLASQIQELFPTLQMMEQLGSSASALGRDAGFQLSGLHLPRQLGEYRVLRVLGRGGMGIVYEAIQESLGRRVALKVLTVHPSSVPSQLERFQREARAAARLHHTNIVPVFAVGQTDSSHYHAMQLIEGQSLDRMLQEIQRLRRLDGGSRAHTAASPAFSGGVAQPPGSSQVAVPDQASQNGSAARGSLQAVGGDAASDRPDISCASSCATVERRDWTVSNGASTAQAAHTGSPYYRRVARIGLQAAEALAYAHEQGVLHRDLKPSNLLLDLHGTLWITDFGLARVAGLHELTGVGDVVGTLRYVPPERFHGLTDARGDIYSLGLTLYELLALRPAFDAPERAQLVHSILHDAVLSLHRFDPQVPRDLETIVLHAVARDPGRRYPTAAELAEDLRRFLADQPIQARRTHLWERTWRWCRRNPYLAVLTTAVAALLLATIAILASSNARIRQEQGAKDAALAQATANAQTAEENYQLARQAIDEYLNRVTRNKELDRDELHELRRELLEQATSFYDKLSRRKGDDQRALADRLAAYLQLGNLHREVADLNAALRDFQAARTLLTSIWPTKLQITTHEAALVDVHINLGAILGDMGRTQESLQEMDQAIRIIDRLAVEQPGEKQHRLTQSKLQYNRCVLLTQLGQLEPALEACQASVRLQSAIVQDTADEGYYAWMLSHSYNRQGMLLADLGRSDQAMSAFAEAAKIQRRLVNATPDLVEPRDALSMTLANQANQLMQQGKPQEAIHLLQESVKMQQAICDEYPSVARYQMSLATHQIRLAAALRELADYPPSLALSQRAADALEAWVAQSDSAPEMIDLLAQAYAVQAIVLTDLEKFEDGWNASLRSVQLLDQLIQEHPQNVDFSITRDKVLNAMGHSALEQGRAEVSLEYFSRVIDHAASVLANHHQLDAAKSVLGEAYAGRAKAQFRLGRYGDAVHDWDRAAELHVASGHLESRVERATSLVYSGAVDRAMAEVGLLAADEQLSGAAAHQLGRISSLAAAATEDAELQEQCASQAVRLFRLALQQGFSDPAYLRTSPELEPLRHRAEFQQLLTELETAAGKEHRPD